MSNTYYSPVKASHSREDRKSAGKNSLTATRGNQRVNQTVLVDQRKKRNYFDEMSCGTKSKLG